jgi:curved DNA-binding protein CbpA
MRNRRNYYRILRVQPDAPVEVIRASFRTLMRELRQHPDLGGNASEATLLNEAYETLRDPALRAAYDKELFARHTRQVLSGAGAPRKQGDDLSCAFCKAPLQRSARTGESCSVCQTPLVSQAAGPIRPLSQRSLTRMRRSGKISFFSRWPQEPHEAEMLDISPKGMRFLCNHQLKTGTILKISGTSFNAAAIVINLRNESAGDGVLQSVGVAFLAVDFENPRGSFLSTTA